jgi:hypothetical protein
MSLYLAYIHKDMYIIFKIHTFNYFIHNCNVTYKVITNYKLLFMIKINIWIIQKIDLSELLSLNMDMNDSSFTQGEMALRYGGLVHF